MKDSSHKRDDEAQFMHAIRVQGGCYTVGRSSRIQYSWSRRSRCNALTAEVAMPKPKVNTHLRFANPDYEPDEDFDPDSVVIARTVAPAINANMHAERMYQAESIYLTALALSIC